MEFTLLTRPFFQIAPDLGDFLKGIGVAIIFSALFVQWKAKRQAGSGS